MSAAVDAPAEASTIVGFPTVADIFAVAGLISAVYVCYVLIRVSDAMHPTVVNVIALSC